MGIFDFLKKNSADVPPDVGKEAQQLGKIDSSGVSDAYDPGELESADEEDVEEAVTKVKGKKRKKGEERVSSVGNEKSNALVNLKLERLDAQVESINGLLKGFNERFSNTNQQIGEIRGISMSNEKAISKLDASTAKAIDIVAEVKPEKIRADYEKSTQKTEELYAKVESNKIYLNTILEEMKDLRRKAESFIGSDGLLGLQKDVKKDLINIQQINAKAKMHADKTEQMFIEMQKRANEYNQFVEKLSNFEANYSFLKKEFEKMRIDFSNIATKADLNEMKKRMESKISLIDGSVSYIERMKGDSDRVLRLVEDSVALSKKNEEDIKGIALNLGDDSVSKVGDYDERLNSMLSIIDTLAGQISSIKNKVGMDSSVNKVKVPFKEKNNENDKFKLENIELHPKMSEALATISKKDEGENENDTSVTFSQAFPDANTDMPEDVKEPVKEITKKQSFIEKINDPLSKSDKDEPNSTIPLVDSEVKNIENKSLDGLEIEKLPEIAISDETNKNIESNLEIKTVEAKQKRKRVSKPKKNIEMEDITKDLEEEIHKIDEKVFSNISPSEDSTSVEVNQKMPENKPSFIQKIKNNLKKPSKTEPLVLPEPVFEESINDEKKIVELKEKIIEGNSVLHSASKKELEERYAVMKKIYESLEVKDEKLFKNIIEFYKHIHGQFYNRVFN